MFEHRFREYLNPPTPTSAAAFVPCPVFASPAQFALVAEVYRLAREMTEAQFREPVRAGIPEFSLN
jgi:hypothetical protein